MPRKIFDGIGTGATIRLGTATFNDDGELDIAETGSGDDAIDPPALEADDKMVDANNGWMGKQYSGKGRLAPDRHLHGGRLLQPGRGRGSGLRRVQRFGRVYDRLGQYPKEIRRVCANQRCNLFDRQRGSAKVGGSGFTHTSGVEEYKLVGNEKRKIISGSFGGVSGTYYCEPSTGATCNATVGASGFTLGGGTWRFKPNAGATIPGEMDANYLLYGYWLQKDGDDWAAGVFTGTEGTNAPSADLIGGSGLQGTAKYSGGAAGKFALSNALGGRMWQATSLPMWKLTAKFGTAAEVSGTVKNFVTGHENDWEVSLNAADLTAGGSIQAETGNNATKTATTTWKIGGDGDGTGRLERYAVWRNSHEGTDGRNRHVPSRSWSERPDGRRVRRDQGVASEEHHAWGLGAVWPREPRANERDEKGVARWLLPS